LDAVVEGLAAHEILPERFPNFEHDSRGIWTAPDGTRIIWFRDPHGNLLSVVRYA
jgi:hypothetical protein